MNYQHLPVRSLSRQIWDAIPDTPAKGQVLGIFHRAIDIQLNGFILALVAPELLNGPFHIVVDFLPVWNQTEFVPIIKEHNGVQIGHWHLHFTPTTIIWEPHLNWKKTHISSFALTNLRSIVIEAVHSRKPQTPFVEVLYKDTHSFIKVFYEGLTNLIPNTIYQAVSQIAGLGPGLTPSGDDFLAGVMLAAHSFSYPKQEKTEHLCQLIYDTASPRTNRISRAFLLSACNGLADERWHNLFSSLASQDTQAIYNATQAVLSFGETSGIDMLTGFLWMSDIAFQNRLTEKTDPHLSTRFSEDLPNYPNSFKQKELLYETC